MLCKTTGEPWKPSSLEPTLAKASAFPALVSCLTVPVGLDNEELPARVCGGVFVRGPSVKPTSTASGDLTPKAAGPAPITALSCVALLSLPVRNLSRLAEKSHLRGVVGGAGMSLA